MKAIVVGFARARHSKPSEEQAVALPAISNLQRCSEQGVRQANRGAKSASGDESIPPFWTWFIENPRGGGAT